MAYALKLPPTVTEEIMRYAVGYPRDRLRAIAARVKRTEKLKPYWKIQIRWELPDEVVLPAWSHIRSERCMKLTWYYPQMYEHNKEELSLPCEILTDKRTRTMIQLQDTCEACEPLSLSAERNHF